MRTPESEKTTCGIVGASWFFWRQGAGQAVLGTIVVGMAVYLPLHLGLGW